nr:penicillin-binding protein [Bacillus testis]
MHGHPAQSSYGSDDERFFPFVLPFIAGLAIGPLLFNRPCCPPYFPPYPPPYPPLAMPIYQQPPYGGIAGPFNQIQQGNTPVYGGITENVNIYTK